MEERAARRLIGEFVGEVQAELDRRGWGRAELADQMRVTPGYLRRVLGTRPQAKWGNVSLRQAARIAQALGLEARVTLRSQAKEH